MARTTAMYWTGVVLGALLLTGCKGSEGTRLLGFQGPKLPEINLPKLPKLPEIPLPKLDLPELGLSEIDLPWIKPKPIVLAQPRFYPQEAEIAEPLDIEVVTQRGSIRLDNRTARSYPGAQLWLNREFGAELETVTIGQGPPMNIKDFVNNFGERYPVGTVLQPEKNRALILADLVVDGKIHKLTVRLKDWRKP